MWHEDALDKKTPRNDFNIIECSCGHQEYQCYAVSQNDEYDEEDMPNGETACRVCFGYHREQFPLTEDGENIYEKDNYYDATKEKSK